MGAVRSLAPQVLNLLHIRGFPIYHQLLLEEALLRNTKENWVLLNDGAFQPAIVMGISGQPEQLIHIPEAVKARIQIIKRFTGGGTVVVDQDTLFASLIFQGDALPDVECYPRPIMRWTEQFYQHVFHDLHFDGSSFALKEHDYVFGPRKFGGNAQAITGKRWIHHTSLLWDYQPERMALLKNPKKAPEYRQGRDHHTFLTTLKEVVTGHRAASSQDQQQGDGSPNQMAPASVDRLQPALDSSDDYALRKNLLDRVVEAAQQLPGLTVHERTLADASRALQGHTICGTKLVDLKQYLEKQQAV